MFFTDRFKDNGKLDNVEFFNPTKMKALLPYVENNKSCVIAFLDELYKTAGEKNPEQWGEGKYVDWENESIPGGFYFYPKEISNDYKIDGFEDIFDNKLYGLGITYLALDRLWKNYFCKARLPFAYTSRHRLHNFKVDLLEMLPLSDLREALSNYVLKNHPNASYAVKRHLFYCSMENEGLKNRFLNWFGW